MLCIENSKIYIQKLLKNNKSYTYDSALMSLKTTTTLTERSNHEEIKDKARVTLQLWK